MFKKLLVVGCLLAAAGTAGWQANPQGLWRQGQQAWENCFGWDTARRQQDPAGYTNHVETRLTQDLAEMRTARRALVASMDDLAKEIHQQEALAQAAEAFAVECREQFHLATADGFQVTVRDAAYTADELRAQVSSLLAEQAGCESAATQLRAVAAKAEREMENLAVRINATETQLAMLPVKRELIVAKIRSHAGDELVQHLDAMLDENQRVIDGSPVRTVRELMAESGVGQSDSNQLIPDQQVEDFLAAPGKLRPQADKEQDKQRSAQVTTFSETSVRSNSNGEPIFRQK